MRDSGSFVRLFVGFILTATGVCYCPIHLNPPRVVVEYGGDVSINCSTTDSRVESMGWEATREGISSEKVQHLTWSIKNLTDWNIFASCYSNLPKDSPIDQCMVEPSIVLYTFPENVVITSSLISSDSVLILNETEEHDISCHVNHVAPVQNLTVRWYKNDTLIQTSAFNSSGGKPENKSSFLNYKMTRQDNGFRFRCEARLDLGPEGPQLNQSSQEFKAVVHYGPDITCSDMEVLEGETLESKCYVEGNPTPSVEWLRDGESMNLNLPLSRNHTGQYTIMARSKSVSTRTIQVVVLYEPTLTCPSNYTVLEFAPHGITCSVDGFPAPVVKWFKDGEEVDLPPQLTRSDAGQYVITASNKVSSVNVPLEIMVTYPPEPIAELEDSEVEVGSDVSFKCASVANPRPRYTWTYYRTFNVKEQSEDGVSLLLIFNATAFNMGSYTCQASNEHGHAFKKATLKVRGAEKECPIGITPGRKVLPAQSKPHTVECNVTRSGDKVVELFWEFNRDNKSIRTDNGTLEVDKEGWDLRPLCKAKFVGLGTCEIPFDYTLYKTPDAVVISSDVSSVVEGRPLRLQCDIINVAPARSLSVEWYRGNEKIESHRQESLTVNCSSNITNCNISTIRSPVTVSSTIWVALNRTHRSVEFKCEVVMNLGAEGPQPSPTATSSPFPITVLSQPVIDTEKLPLKVPVFRGYPEELKCEADGHPTPKIQWFYSSDSAVNNNNTLTVYEAGLYNCTATNAVGSSFRAVEVILKEDYLPLIAGFVAVTVVAISVVFLFIYSIYYKNTKMRRYSLKNPKLSNHNGNVAHNGWDMQFPMTRLS